MRGSSRTARQAQSSCELLTVVSPCLLGFLITLHATAGCTLSTLVASMHVMAGCMP
jgi:hypothetical protein